MNLPNVNFNTKNYSSNNSFNNNNRFNNSNFDTNSSSNQHLYKSLNGQYYENYDEVRKQNLKVYNNFAVKPNKK